MSERESPPNDAPVKRTPRRVLIISFHFPPMNAISSFRAEGFARYLPDHGMEVTVVTSLRDPATGRSTWSPRGTPIATSRWEQCTVYHVPRVRSLYYRLVQASLKVPFLSTLVAMAHCSAGTFNLHMIDVHHGYKRFLRQHLRTNSYDVILTTAPPDEHIAIAAWAQERYGIPFIADYRDLYDNRLLSPSFHPTYRERVLLAMRKRWHRNWLRYAASTTTVSEPLTAILSSHLGIPKALEVRNGYEPRKVLSDESHIDRDNFRITYAGRILPHQDLQPFFEAYRRFVDRSDIADLEHLRLSFYGIIDRAQADNIRAQNLPGTVTIEPDRIPHEEMLEHIARSSILLIFNYDQTGVYSGKIMEYIGAKRNILMIPSDHGVIAELIEHGRFGSATDHTDTAADYLQRCYAEWRRGGVPKYSGDPAVGTQMTREAQTAKLAEVILSMVPVRSQSQADRT